MEKNEDIKKGDDTDKKEENILKPRIIEESEDYSPIEDILQERQNKNNILNNNQIYFTEANTLIPREYIDTKDIKDIHKSNSNKLYTLTSIPEYSNIKIKKTAETPLKIKSINSQDKTKNKNICLNNLSPEIYMKKKFRVNKENDLNCLKVRIKQIEEEILKRNEYDYKSAMKECKLQYMKDIKNKEKEKQIIEENKKFEEKLKNMEEYRKNLINNRIKNDLKDIKRSKEYLDKLKIAKEYYETFFESKTDKIQEVEDKIKGVNEGNIYIINDWEYEDYMNLRIIYEMKKDLNYLKSSYFKLIYKEKKIKINDEGDVLNETKNEFNNLNQLFSSKDKIETKMKDNDIQKFLEETMSRNELEKEIKVLYEIFHEKIIIPDNVFNKLIKEIKTFNTFYQIKIVIIGSVKLRNKSNNQIRHYIRILLL